MKSYLIRRLLIIVGGLVFILAGCKDGDPGIAGSNGTNGTSGINGINGTNGQGYAQAVKNGSIIIYLDGKRPDGIAFKDTISYPYSSSDLDYSWFTTPSTETYFETRRFQGMDCSLVDNYADIYLEQSLVDETDYYIYFTLKASVATSDFEYFDLDDSYYNNDNVNIDNPSFTNFSFDSPSGHLKYLFSFAVLAGNNGTGFDLNVSGAVDAITYLNVSETKIVPRGPRVNIKSVMKKKQ